MALIEGTKFWMVWSPRGGMPKRKYPIRDMAETEAHRLSEKFPGRHFYLLEHVGFAMVGENIPTENQQRKAEAAAKESCQTPAEGV